MKEVIKTNEENSIDEMFQSSVGAGNHVYQVQFNYFWI